jgi:hypothetical protein
MVDPVELPLLRLGGRVLLPGMVAHVTLSKPDSIAVVEDWRRGALTTGEVGELRVVVCDCVSVPKGSARAHVDVWTGQGAPPHCTLAKYFHRPVRKRQSDVGSLGRAHRVRAPHSGG